MDSVKRDAEKQTAKTPIATERTKTGRVFVPKVDIREAIDSMVLIADMPGVDEKSVDITLDRNILTIRGTVAPLAFADHSAAYVEYDEGDFERAFKVSDEIDRDSIAATVKKNGVLKVTLHKAEKMKARKIAITAA